MLPSLRRALVEAESGGTVERLAADLRSAVDEVESLLVSRRSIVLEEMGLLAAIEWLAERIEDRSDVRVEIEVEGDTAVVGEAVTRPPRDAERAAFRVAQLALDNVVRHVPGGVAVVTIAVVARADPAPDRGRRHEPPDRRGGGGPGRATRDRRHARRGRLVRRHARWASAAAPAGAARPSRSTWREPPASR